MKIDSIKCGTVIDHIAAGKAMRLYEMLHLDRLDCCVAVLQNVTSKKMGKKDIIKIDSDVRVDLNVVGYVSPDATINFIENGEIVRKECAKMPERLVNILFCKNPRCITTTEQEIPHIFVRTGTGEYRCLYCETKAN